VSDLNSYYHWNNYLIEISFMYLSHSSGVLTVPIVRCDDQLLKTVIKWENIDKADHNNFDHLSNRVIKQEIIDETNHNNDDQLLQIG